MPRKAKDTLRPYQATLIAEILPALAAHGSVVMQLPTGGGKTHIATEIAHRVKSHGRSVWFVCHRREILTQTAKAFQAAGIDHGVVKAGTKITEQHAVWICSVDALARRLEQMDPPDVVIWDECHHVVARTWAEMKAQLGAAQHLGMTATPARLDGTGLGKQFKHMVCGPDTRTLIEQGHLSTYRLFGPTIPDMRQVRTKLGDYDKGDVEKEMTRPVLVGDVVDHYKRLAPGARAIAFAISVKASQAVVERFLAAGIPAQHVDAKTPPAEREAAIEALRTGTVKVLSNVQLFDEGFDCPAIDAVILLRPTKSLAMYRQMIGRGLRTYPGKAATVILDHSGLVHEHGLPDEHIEWNLEGFSRPPEGKEGEGRPRLRICPECSAIHVWAVECVECGHGYVAEERSIEEVYGELRAIHKIGDYESFHRFAARHSTTYNTINKLIGRGMPAIGKQIPIEAATEWLKQNFKGSNTPPIGSAIGTYEAKNAFAKRVGMSAGTIGAMVRDGLPCAANGWVHINDGLVWVRQHYRGKLTIPTNVVDAGLYEPGIRFSARIGVSQTMVRKLIRAGLPHAENGWVHVENGLLWVKQNYSKEPGIPIRQRVEEGSLRAKGFIKRSEFAKNMCLSSARIASLTKDGLPSISFGRTLWVDATQAEAWLRHKNLVH